MPWFFYDWTPDPEDTELLVSAPRDIPPARSLLVTRGRYLEPLQQAYIESCLSTPFSFFDVISCSPGQGYKLKDIFTGKILDVVEKMGSEKAKIGDIIFGKPVTVNELTTMEASAPFLIPPVRKAPLLKLRKAIERHYKSVTDEVLRKCTVELIKQYQAYYELLLNPPAPIITNTDGDPFSPHELVFDIDSSEMAFGALKSLNFEDTEEIMLQDAKFDEDQNLTKIEFPWLKKGNKQSKSWKNTVLGHITIEKTTLKVRVNSEKRANIFRAIVEERLGKKARYKTTLIEPVELGLGRKSAQTKDDHKSNHPEIQAKLAEINSTHWDCWIHEKVPALGNKTPIQAAKTKDGKEMLNALLTQFEREAANRLLPGVTVQTFKNIRERLRLNIF